MKPNLVIEKSTPADNNIKSIFQKVKSYTKEDIVRNYQNYLPSLKIGAGGSHIWISKGDERIAIINL